MTDPDPGPLGPTTTRTPQEQAMISLRELFQAGDLFRGRVAARFGLGWTEQQSLGQLVRAGELGQNELASRLSITSGAATALVDRLERLDLAARHAHPDDRRRSLVRLTARGHEVIDESRDWMRYAFDGLPADELAAVCSVLDRIADRLCEQAEVVEAARPPGTDD